MSKAKWLASPRGLSEKALEIWHLHAPRLVLEERLTRENAENFGNLCRILALIGQASDEIGTTGVLITTPTGARKTNPAVSVLLSAQRDAGRLLREFGMD